MSEAARASLEESKRRLRLQARRVRAGAAEAGRGAGEAVRERLLAGIALPGAAAIAGYWPIRSELDPRPSMQALEARGHTLCLPVIIGAGRPLIFRAWRCGEPLQSAEFGTQVPAAGRPEVPPAALLVPLLAFDRAGYRLGYGGGFYDRTLRTLRAAAPVLAVGLAYQAQEVSAVPRDASDQPLDWIVTETETIRVGGGGSGSAAEDA